MKMKSIKISSLIGISINLLILINYVKTYSLIKDLRLNDSGQCELNGLILEPGERQNHPEECLQIVCFRDGSGRAKVNYCPWDPDAEYLDTTLPYPKCCRVKDAKPARRFHSYREPGGGYRSSKRVVIQNNQSNYQDDSSDNDINVEKPIRKPITSSTNHRQDNNNNDDDYDSDNDDERAPIQRPLKPVNKIQTRKPFFKKPTTTTSAPIENNNSEQDSDLESELESNKDNSEIKVETTTKNFFRRPSRIPSIRVTKSHLSESLNENSINQDETITKVNNQIKSTESPTTTTTTTTTTEKVLETTTKSSILDTKLEPEELESNDNDFNNKPETEASDSTTKSQPKEDESSPDVEKSTEAVLENDADKKIETTTPSEVSTTSEAVSSTTEHITTSEATIENKNNLGDNDKTAEENAEESVEPTLKPFNSRRPRPFGRTRPAPLEETTTGKALAEEETSTPGRRTRPTRAKETTTATTPVEEESSTPGRSKLRPSRAQNIKTFKNNIPSDLNKNNNDIDENENYPKWYINKESTPPTLAATPTPSIESVSVATEMIPETTETPDDQLIGGITDRKIPSRFTFEKFYEDEESITEANVGKNFEDADDSLVISTNIPVDIDTEKPVSLITLASDVNQTLENLEFEIKEKDKSQDVIPIDGSINKSDDQKDSIESSTEVVMKSTDSGSSRINLNNVNSEEKSQADIESEKKEEMLQATENKIIGIILEDEKLNDSLGSEAAENVTVATEENFDESSKNLIENKEKISATESNSEYKDVVKNEEPEIDSQLKEPSSAVKVESNFSENSEKSTETIKNEESTKSSDNIDSAIIENISTESYESEHAPVARELQINLEAPKELESIEVVNNLSKDLVEETNSSFENKNGFSSVLESSNKIDLNENIKSSQQTESSSDNVNSNVQSQEILIPVQVITIPDEEINIIPFNSELNSEIKEAITEKLELNQDTQRYTEKNESINLEEKLNEPAPEKINLNEFEKDIVPDINISFEITKEVENASQAELVDSFSSADHSDVLDKQKILENGDVIEANSEKDIENGNSEPKVRETVTETQESILKTNKNVKNQDNSEKINLLENSDITDNSTADVDSMKENYQTTGTKRETSDDTTLFSDSFQEPIDGQQKLLDSNDELKSLLQQTGEFKDATQQKIVESDSFELQALAKAASETLKKFLDSNDKLLALELDKFRNAAQEKIVESGTVHSSNNQESSHTEQKILNSDLELKQVLEENAKLKDSTQEKVVESASKHFSNTQESSHSEQKILDGDAELKQVLEGNSKLKDSTQEKDVESSHTEQKILNSDVELKQVLEENAKLKDSAQEKVVESGSIHSSATQESSNTEQKILDSDAELKQVLEENAKLKDSTQEKVVESASEHFSNTQESSHSEQKILDGDAELKQVLEENAKLKDSDQKKVVESGSTHSGNTQESSHTEQKILNSDVELKQVLEENAKLKDSTQEKVIESASKHFSNTQESSHSEQKILDGDAKLTQILEENVKLKDSTQEKVVESGSIHSSASQESSNTEQKILNSDLELKQVLEENAKLKDSVQEKVVENSSVQSNNNQEFNQSEQKILGDIGKLEQVLQKTAQLEGEINKKLSEDEILKQQLNSNLKDTSQKTVIEDGSNIRLSNSQEFIDTSQQKLLSANDELKEILMDVMSNEQKLIKEIQGSIHETLNKDQVSDGHLNNNQESIDTQQKTFNEDIELKQLLKELESKGQELDTQQRTLSDDHFKDLAQSIQSEGSNDYQQRTLRDDSIEPIYFREEGRYRIVPGVTDFLNLQQE